MAEQINPLKPEHLEQINNALRLLHHAESIMDRACAAGMNCDEQRMKADALRKSLEGLKTQFFGNGR